MANMMGAQAKNGEAVWINLDRVSRIIEKPDGLQVVFSGGDDYVDIKSTMHQVLNSQTINIG